MLLLRNINKTLVLMAVFFRIIFLGCFLSVDLMATRTPPLEGEISDGGAPALTDLLEAIRLPRRDIILEEGRRSMRAVLPVDEGYESGEEDWSEEEMPR